MKHILTLAALLLSFPGAFAQTDPTPVPISEPTPEVTQEVAAKENEPKFRSRFDLEISGYGEMAFSYFGYGADQTQPGGSSDENRAEFDLGRFVLELVAEMPAGLEVESEIEFEHGGTGAELELEYEEFGEFDKDVGKGGEVLVEELYLKKRFNDHWSARLGRFYVNFGLVSDELTNYRLPTSMVAGGRPESESSLIPAVWDEMGISLEARYPDFRWIFQIVNGLDSTGFSSQNWIASGHQRRFELIKANDIAINTRLDITRFPVLFGTSFYWAPDTIGNRPKNDIPDATAALYLVDAHATWNWKNLRSRACVIWGHLDNAELLSDKNRQLSNNLDVLRSPVSDNALAAWAEWGWDVAPYLGLNDNHLVEPHFRFDYYDTQFQPRGTLFDNPRFERTVYTAGVGYTYQGFVTAKLDWVHRELGSDAFRAENGVQLNVGFEY